jgi:hypothetical protein
MFHVVATRSTQTLMNFTAMEPSTYEYFWPLPTEAVSYENSHAFKSRNIYARVKINN